MNTFQYSQIRQINKIIFRFGEHQLRRFDSNRFKKQDKSYNQKNTLIIRVFFFIKKETHSFRSVSVFEGYSKRGSYLLRSLIKSSVIFEIIFLPSISISGIFLTQEYLSLPSIAIDSIIF